MEKLCVLNFEGENWVWPSNDMKLMLVFKHRADIDVMLNYVKDCSVCVQAGGATGVWPIEFSKYFDKVYTFEPDRTNYAALAENIEDKLVSNVIYRQAALGDKPHNIKIVRDPCHVDNYGAGYAVEGGDTPCVTIDSLGLDSCGLIQLDIEGYELKALQGAAETIKRFKPVIVLEVKPHPQMKGRNPREAADHLINLGYKEVAHLHRDIVFSWPE